MAEYEAEAWLNGLTGEEFEEVIGFGFDIDFLKGNMNEALRLRSMNMS